MDQKRWSLQEKVASLSIGAIFVFIISAAIAGIIGNIADTLFICLWSLFHVMNTWPWIITVAIMTIGFIFVLFVVWQKDKAVRLELHRVNGALDKIGSPL